MGVHEDLLVADFEQCFEQMRHYDETFRRTLEFDVGGVVAVIAASAALLGQYGPSYLVITSVGLLLVVSSLAGFLLVVSLARNRVYFAFVGRYVNEVRTLYLSHSPGGVSNKAGIYADYKFPSIFNPVSSHAIQLYFLSSCNSFLLTGSGAALFASRAIAMGKSLAVGWGLLLGAFVVFLLLQVGWILLYWYLKERQKTADTAVFRKRR